MTLMQLVQVKALVRLLLPGFKGSSGVGDGTGSFAHTTVTSGTTFTASSSHGKGNKTYNYDSTTGIINETS